MINLFRNFLKLLKNNRLQEKANIHTNQNIDFYEDLNLSENLSAESIDLVFAINENSIIPAKNLASQTNSLTIVDLNQTPEQDNLDNPRFHSALSSAHLIFSANRKLATELEQNLKRHIIISRHLAEQKVESKYIDLKKVYHLIDDTQLIIFDAKICHPFLNEPYDLLKHNLAFIASILSQLPHHIHVIIVGGLAENKIFEQQKNTFEKHECTSRIHFYIENLEAIKYPIDYSNIDIALLLGDQEDHTPTQYYKYLHEEVVMFTTEFADANQLVTSANIGQIFNNQNADQWVEAINSFLELSETKRDEFKDNLHTQKQHINWQQETSHFISSIMNMLQLDLTNKLHAVIVDLSKHQISQRTHNIGHILVDQGINVSILTPFLPTTHTPQTSNIEYIKVS